jgi:polyphosphate kinase
MKMSYSNELLLEREKFLEGYSTTLEEFQSMRRRRLTQQTSNNQSKEF